MLHALLADARFWQLLHRLDEDLAATAGAARCPHCGGRCTAGTTRVSPWVDRARLGGIRAATASVAAATVAGGASRRPRCASSAGGCSWARWWCW